jgi:hypothetical protein
VRFEVELLELLYDHKRQDVQQDELRNDDEAEEVDVFNHC